MDKCKWCGGLGFALAETDNGPRAECCNECGLLDCDDSAATLIRRVLNALADLDDVGACIEFKVTGRTFHIERLPDYKYGKLLGRAAVQDFAAFLNNKLKAHEQDVPESALIEGLNKLFRDLGIGGRS